MTSEKYNRNIRRQQQSAGSALSTVDSIGQAHETERRFDYQSGTIEQAGHTADDTTGGTDLRSEMIVLLHHLIYALQFSDVPDTNLMARANAALIKLEAGSVIHTWTKPETIMEVKRMIRSRFDATHWTYAQQYIDMAEDLGMHDLANEMERDLNER